MGEAVHQAVADGVRRMQEDDRDPVAGVRGGVLRGARWTCPRTRRSGRRARERIPAPAPRPGPCRPGCARSARSAGPSYCPWTCFIRPFTSVPSPMSCCITWAGRTVEPAEIAEPRDQRGKGRRVVVRPHMHHADAWDRRWRSGTTAAEQAPTRPANTRTRSTRPSTGNRPGLHRESYLSTDPRVETTLHAVSLQRDDPRRRRGHLAGLEAARRRSEGAVAWIWGVHPPRRRLRDELDGHGLWRRPRSRSGSRWTSPPPMSTNELSGVFAV